MSIRDITPYLDVTFVNRDTGETWALAAGKITDHTTTYDDSWTPYAQARVTAKIDDELADVIDPTQGTRIYARMRFQRRRGDLGDYDQTLREEGWQVRSLTRDYIKQTMTISLASYEAAASQYAQARLNPGPDGYAWPAGTDIQTIVGTVLQGNAPGFLESDPNLSFQVAEDTQWESGQSITEYLQPLVAPTGRKLLCTPTGADGPWRLHVPGTPVDPPDPTYTWPVYDLDELIEFETRSSLDSSPYTDDVAIFYEWEWATDGSTRRRVDRTSIEGTVPYAKWTVEHVNAAFPGTGGAAALRDRLNQWRYERTFTRLWDLYLRPGMRVGVRMADDVVTTMRVQSVEFTADGIMRVVGATPNITPTPGMWDAVDPAITWDSVDPATTWDDLATNPLTDPPPERT